VKSKIWSQQDIFVPILLFYSDLNPLTNKEPKLKQSTKEFHFVFSSPILFFALNPQFQKQLLFLKIPGFYEKEGRPYHEKRSPV
jgi:hypothetical protein